MMLYVLKSMTWYLKTAFGQSEISFGGRRAAPPGFLAVYTLMINVYRNLSYGVIHWGLGTGRLHPVCSREEVAAD
jgi:hypothetical protein